MGLVEGMEHFLELGELGAPFGEACVFLFDDFGWGALDEGGVVEFCLGFGEFFLVFLDFFREAFFLGVHVDEASEGEINFAERGEGDGCAFGSLEVWVGRNFFGSDEDGEDFCFVVVPVFR